MSLISPSHLSSSLRWIPENCLQGLAHHGEPYIELHAHGDRGERVDHVVYPRRGKADLTQVLTFVAHDEAGAEAVMAQVDRPQVGPFRKAVRHIPPLEGGDEAREMLVVHAQDDDAEEGHLVHEGEEGGLDLVHVLVEVEVLQIDVRNHGDRGEEYEEGAVTFVRLGHEVLARAELRVGSQAVEPPPITQVGSRPRAAEHGCNQGGRGGLAVGARHRYAVLHPHQLGEHLGPLDDGYGAALRLLYLRIVRPHRRGGDHHLRILHVLRPVVVQDLRAELLQPCGDLRLPDVGPGYPEPEVEEHLGYSAHADASDADKVDTLYLMKHLLLSPV